MRCFFVLALIACLIVPAVAGGSGSVLFQKAVDGTTAEITSDTATFSTPTSTIGISAQIDGSTFTPTGSPNINNNGVTLKTNEKQYLIFDNPDIQEAYTYTSGNLEESLVLKTPHSVSYILTLPDGASLVPTDNGAVKVSDPNANEASDGYIVISPAVGTDADGNTVAFEYSIDGNTINLVFPAKQTIAYPLTIDPTIGRSYDLKLLLHMNQMETGNASTSDFPDSSRYLHATQAYTDVSSIAAPMFGNASLTSQNVVARNLSVSSSPDFELDQNNWSLNYFINMTTAPLNNGTFLITSTCNNACVQSNDFFEVFLVNQSAIEITSVDLTGGTVIVPINYTVIAGSPLPLNKQNQITIIQNQSTNSIYVNGTLKGSTTRQSRLMHYTDNTVTIGGNVYAATNTSFLLPGTAGIAGQIDELSLWIGGNARNINEFYPASEYPMYRNTTASPPSGGYADDNSTVSLLHFDGANAATAPWVDETGKVWYNMWGWSNLSTANYKFGTASLLNPAGSGIGYTIPAPVLKSDFNLSTGDFTYDAWVYPVASPGTAYAAVLSTMNTTGDGYLFGIGGTVNPQALIILGNASGVSATYDAVSPNGAIPYNQWSHVAYVRSGNNLLLFANGTLLSTTPITASYKYNAYNKAVLIGASLTDVPTAWNYNGYVDESRLSKGIARWTTSFTPPTYQYETTNAAFVYTIVNIYGPLPVSVQFNDTTPDSNWTQNAFYWDFGDGSTSTQENPVHSYASAGIKTVILQTFNNYMTSTTTQNIGLGIPLADFIGAPTSSTAAPVVVQFTDLTENLTPITWNWSFGDGTYSNDQNPVHAYSWGIFDVNETATSVQGSSYKFKHNYIQVSASQVPAQNTWWTPHTVQITVMDLFGARLYNVNVNATYNQSSMPTAWITELYGIQGTPAGDMVNRTLMMSGSTGSDGTITFTMLGSLKYDFTLQSTTYGLNANRSLFPSDSMVNFYLSTAGQQLPTGTNNTYTSLNGTRVYFTEPNASYGSMCIDYIDTSGNTAYVNESWWFTNNLSIFNWANFTPGTTLSTHCYTMKNVKGTTTWWQYSAGRVT